MLTTRSNPASGEAARDFSFVRLTKSLARIFASGKPTLFRRAFQAELGNYVAHTLGFPASRFTCNICRYTGPFVHLYDELRISLNSACPVCDSRSRHRGLFFLYEKIIGGVHGELRVLHFAPEPVFTSLFGRSRYIRYHTTDIALHDVDFTGEDIQKLTFSDSSYDLVLANHVLEHVKDDSVALDEIRRVLTPGGRAILTVPGDFSRQSTRQFGHLRYNGHYRDYGLDFEVMLRRKYSEVQSIDLSELDPGGLHAIRSRDMAFLCTR